MNIFKKLKFLLYNNSIIHKLVIITMEDETSSIQHPIVKMEEANIQKWKELNVYQKIKAQTEKNNYFSFLDGPPFCTGKMHFGHLCVSINKDIICRHRTMQFYRIPRLLGFDCHGLPIEYEIEKKIGVRTKSEIEAYGLKNYNDQCRGIVLSCVDDWGNMFERVGRWNEYPKYYKTMDTTYMESVWWCFSELFKKGLVYKGFKIMPYSTVLATSLSNFETNESYEDVTEDTVVVSFELTNIELSNKFYGSKVIVWTTTPWTLPSNLALCVNKKFSYVILHDKKTNEKYIIAKDCIPIIYKISKKQSSSDYYEILEEFPGEELIGLHYKPLLPYFEYLVKTNNDVFQIIEDDYVTSDNGTGIVHLAPMYGEDDFRVCCRYNITTKDGKNMICPLDANGKYTSEIYDMVGVYVKDADPIIIERLKTEKKLVSKFKHTHSYPFCWRSHTPLIYRAMSEWFIDVESIKDRLIANNNKINWVPKSIGTGRFGKWLENTYDWCVSRGRYWGTPLPIWTSDDMEEIVCISSIQELEQLAGLEKGSITDLHRENIDPITIPSKQGKGILHRVKDVFDCWFESGAAPYASIHYPFENTELFNQTFPIDFISESQDQCRGWFYTLMILSTALFDQPAFKNVIVTGMVLAKDGKKMSKHLHNYSDPMDVINKFGVDALRLYLLSSSICKAESIKFNEDNLINISKNSIVQLYNSMNFLKQHGGNFVHSGHTFDWGTNSNLLFDNWIKGRTNKFVNDLIKNLDQYTIYNLYNIMQNFIYDLNTKYIKINRDSLKGKVSLDVWRKSLMTLIQVLRNVSIVVAPIIPFLSEYIYQELKQFTPTNINESVHLCTYADIEKFSVNIDDMEHIDNLMLAIDSLHQIRSAKNLTVKKPIKSVVIATDNTEMLNNLIPLFEYITIEINVLNITTDQINKYVKYSFEPNMKTMGKAYRTECNQISEFLKTVTDSDIKFFDENGYITYNDHRLTSEYITKIPIINNPEHYEYVLDEKSKLLILADITQDDETEKLFHARLIATAIQRMRKDAELLPKDDIVVNYSCDNQLHEFINSHMQDITNIIRTDMLYDMTFSKQPVIDKDLDINGNIVHMSLFYRE